LLNALRQDRPDGIFASQVPMALRIRLVIATAAENFTDGVDKRRDEARDAAYIAIFRQVDLSGIVRAVGHGDAEQDWISDRNNRWHRPASASSESQGAESASDQYGDDVPASPSWAIFAQLQPPPSVS
jgi:hypothetical protein